MKKEELKALAESILPEVATEIRHRVANETSYDDDELIISYYDDEYILSLIEESLSKNDNHNTNEIIDSVYDEILSIGFPVYLEYEEEVEEALCKYDQELDMYSNTAVEYYTACLALYSSFDNWRDNYRHSYEMRCKQNKEQFDEESCFDEYYNR